MRTRTNLNFGEDTSSGIRVLSALYQAGNVNVFYEDREKAEEFCRLLTLEGYKADLLEAGKGDFKKSGFTVALGGEKACFAAKRLAKGRYAFFPDFVFPELFMPYNGVFAEFCFIDTSIFRPSSETALKNCFACVAALFAEACAVFYKDKGGLFKDKALEGLLSGAKKILFGNEDREEYVRSCMRWTSLATERLKERSVAEFTVSETARRLGGGTENYLNAAYYFHRLLILFTKWNFRDMLIPAEKLVPEVVTDARPRYGEKDLLLTREELKNIFAKVGFRFGGAAKKEITKAFSEAVNADNPLFAEIYNRGIPEGIIGYG